MWGAMELEPGAKNKVSIVYGPIAERSINGLVDLRAANGESAWQLPPRKVEPKTQPAGPPSQQQKAAKLCAAQACRAARLSCHQNHASSKTRNPVMPTKP